MIESIITGIGFGIVLSFVTGPVFFALIKTSIERGFYPAICLAGGVLMSDVIYVAISIFGSSFLMLEGRYKLPIGLAGCVVLAALGCYYLFKKVEICFDNTITKKHYYGYFFKGFLMCIFNPGILFYWVTVMSQVVSISGHINPRDVIPFYASILATQFSMDTLKAWYASKLRHKINEYALTWLNRIAGGLMLIFAVKMLWGLFFK